MFMISATRCKCRSASGVGKKTADRVVVDLSDKVGLATHYEGAPIQTELNTNDEALEALMALGYSLNDASKALENVSTSASTAERVTQALKGAA
jgi:Holliday junction DNA helicase RuvA